MKIWILTRSWEGPHGSCFEVVAWWRQEPKLKQIEAATGLKGRKLGCGKALNLLQHGSTTQGFKHPVGYTLTEQEEAC